MIKLSILPIAFLLSSVLTSYAQSPTWVQQDPKPYIEVTGKAEKEVIPDEIYIAITIKERHEGKKKITVEGQEALLKEALKTIGISPKNLSLTDVYSKYVKVRIMKMDVINKSNYSLKVKDAATVGNVFDALEKLSITNAHISRVDHSKKREIKKEMRIQAIKAAKEKARYLLSAIDQNLGTPLVVKEQFTDSSRRNYRGNVYANQTYQYSASSERVVSDDNTLQFKKIKIQASVYIKYEIK